jgi:phage repressor protein C with HTH and peptisase S24 domain
MVDTQDSRAVLERLIRERREDYAGLSRLIGRNPAYIQQFIKRGTPRKLDESDRRTLARYFGIDESWLGGAQASEQPSGALVEVPFLNVRASAGSGAVAELEAPRGRFGFDPRWLRRLTGSKPDRLSIITVMGDSMFPTLSDGDEVIVDGGDGAERLRDGIYVLRVDDALLVKRLALGPTGRRISVRSDNKAYPSWEDCDPSDLQIVGRVVWFGRKLS